MAHFRSVGAAGIVAAGLVVAGCTSGGPGVGSAGACAAPEASPSPASAAEGDTVAIRGTYFGPCNDTNMSSEAPWKQVDLLWVQDGATTPLGSARLIGDTGELSGEIIVPAGALPGEASVRVVMPGIYGSIDVPVTVISTSP